jgi:putative N-acetyltransferase (TIGR04045 family)
MTYVIVCAQSEESLEKILFKIAESENELEEYFHLRQQIFVEEQKIFTETDIDEYDSDPVHEVIHIIAIKESDGKMVGGVRCYKKEGRTWFGGRLSASKDYRTGRVGAGLVKFAVETIKSTDCDTFLAYVQPLNVRFFMRLGWSKIGELETYQEQPHQLMRANLESD